MTNTDDMTFHGKHDAENDDGRGLFHPLREPRHHGAKIQADEKKGGRKNEE